jgi:hypothetical protein
MTNRFANNQASQDRPLAEPDFRQPLASVASVPRAHRRADGLRGTTSGWNWSICSSYAFGDPTALQQLITSVGYKTDFQVTSLNETLIMLVVLALIDVVMISNLLIMVIVGGYETFVSRMNLEGHADQPEWLEWCERVGAEGQSSPPRSSAYRPSTCCELSSMPPTTRSRC